MGGVRKLVGLARGFQRTGHIITEVNGDAFAEQRWRGGVLRAASILAADRIYQSAHGILKQWMGLRLFYSVKERA